MNDIKLEEWIPIQDEFVEAKMYRVFTEDFIPEGLWCSSVTARVKLKYKTGEESGWYSEPKGNLNCSEYYGKALFGVSSCE